MSTWRLRPVGPIHRGEINWSTHATEKDDFCIFFLCENSGVVIDVCVKIGSPQAMKQRQSGEREVYYLFSFPGRVAGTLGGSAGEAGRGD